MMDDLEDLSCHRLCALENIEANKLRVARHYNKKVKNKQFCEGELVWNVTLPLGLKTTSLANVHLIGKVLIGLNIERLAMLIFWKC